MSGGGGGCCCCGRLGSPAECRLGLQGVRGDREFGGARAAELCGGLANGSFQPCLVGGHWRSAGGSPDSRGDKLEPALYPGPRV